MSMSSISQASYETLREIFAERKAKEVFEIEIVPPEVGPLLRDGRCIGITKPALTKAFIIARQRLLDFLVERDKAEAAIEREADLAVATEIILLFDCEHVTACNWRKRLISASKKRNDPCISEDLLERERSLMTSFLCSPLHRHTKSPTLWQHRLWIITELLDQKIHQSSLQQAARISGSFDNYLHDIILEEFDVVCKAGQLHPRNYYAFSYMRQVHTLMERSLSAAMITTNRALPIEFAVGRIDSMLKWCLSNPSDISGWMYLLFLLDQDDQIKRTSSSMQPGECPHEKRSFVMDRTIHFALQIADWEGESLWTFVDLMLAKFGVTVLTKRGASDIPPFRDSLGEGHDGEHDGKKPYPRWRRRMDQVRNLYAGN